VFEDAFVEVGFAVESVHRLDLRRIALHDVHEPAEVLPSLFAVARIV
jgi:hypothetical protein